MNHPPLYLSAATVRDCLSEGEVFEVVSQTMRDMSTPKVVLGPTEVFAVDNGCVRDRMGSMAGAVVPERAAGLKWFFVPGREGPSHLPHVPATILISNIETGLLDGIIDATFLTAERTAAMGIAAALAAARRPIKRATVIGAGFIGRAVARYFGEIDSVKNVVIASRSYKSATFAQEHAIATSKRIIDFQSTTDIYAAVHDADLIITATAVIEDTDIILAKWLKQDAIVCSLGSAREVDLELIKTAWLVVHDIEHVRQRRTDLCKGGPGWNRHAGNVADLMAGSLPLPNGPARIHIIVGSIGALDIALGARALKNARLKKLGLALN